MGTNKLKSRIPTAWFSSAPGARDALAIGLAAACAFVGICGINLSAQGLYADEVHQVPAAFAYQGAGSWPPFFATAFVRGKPLMTMSYSGAVKPALYGLYLRLTGSGFTVEGWRWLGIAIVAATFPAFSLLARRLLSASGLLVFFGLLVTDATVVLGCRHDWGPVALALALRMAFLGILLHGQGDGPVRPRNTFLLGAVVGFSIYEKLSAVVLLPALGILLLCRERRTVRHWSACLVGGLAGGMPLLVANYLVFSGTGRLLSTSQVAVQGDKSLAGLAHQLGAYLALGDGALVRRFILGGGPDFAIAEASLLGVALMAALGLRRARPASRLPAILIACYLAIGVALFLLPNATWAHHWVIGTPFQYLALAMAIAGRDHPVVRSPRPAFLGRAALLGAVVALMAVRVYGAVELARALGRGDASDAWSPSLTRLGELGAARAGHDVFLAGNWGVGIQMYCLSDGSPELVREAYLAYEGPTGPAPGTLPDPARIRALYLVLKAPPYMPDTAGTRRLIAAIEGRPDLREVPVEADFARLAGVKVRKFLDSHAGSTPSQNVRTRPRPPARAPAS